MKLYITTDNIGIQSGGGQVTKNELEALKSLDEVIVISGEDINPVKFHLPDTPFLQDYLTLQKLSEIDLSKVDLAHFYAGPFTQTIRYLKTKGIKITLTSAAHDRKESIKEFENITGNYPFIHVKDDILWNIYNGAVHEADIVIVPSRLSAEFLKGEGVKEDKIRIIPHGTTIPDENIIKPIPERFNVGYLGQSGPDKGLIYLIRAWAQLNYQDNTLLFAGNQSQQLTPFINKYATGGKYHLIGYINDVADFYNGISIYVQSSVTEAFGMTVIQAMSYGRPVICSNGAGATDIVTDNENGFIVNKRDPNAIADKIDWFKNHQKELIEMGKNARERSLNYDWSKIREMYIWTWKNLLNN